MLRRISLAVGLYLLAPSCAQQGQQNLCDPVANSDECRPFRSGIVKFNPQLDATKPLGAIDEAGWSVAGNLLLGAVDSNWLVGYELKSKKMAWWLKTETDVTGPISVFGSWAIAPLRDGRLLKFETQTGKVLWESRLSRFVSNKTILTGTTLLAYTVDQKLFAVDFQTGQTLWIFDAGAPANLLLRTLAAPVATGNDVMIGSSDGAIYSISLSTGKENWRYQATGDDRRFLDIVGEIGFGNHQIYVSRYDGEVFALDVVQKPKEPVWKSSFPTITTSAFHDGTLYVACVNGDLMALQATSGRQLWKVNVGQSVKSLTIGEKSIFVGGSSGRVMALASVDGSTLWHDDLRGILTQYPVVVDDQIYFSTGLKVLYGFKIL